MTVRSSGDTGSVAVEWRSIPETAVPSPIVRRVPYVELKLEHPDLDPAGYTDRFFPDGVPYSSADEQRMFYWRPVLAARSAVPAAWEFAVATPESLLGAGTLPTPELELTVETPDGTTVVVDGTIAGESTTATVRTYDPPTVSVDAVTSNRIELDVGGSTHAIAAGDRTTLEFGEYEVEYAGENGWVRTTITPELVVRYPGERVLHHPAPQSSYRLFPSFDIEVEDLQNPLSVPTTAGELDYKALAERLDVPLENSAYPERVLWQAFCYTAFEPHADGTPAITQMASGHLAVR